MWFHGEIFWNFSALLFEDILRRVSKKRIFLTSLSASYIFNEMNLFKAYKHAFYTNLQQMWTLFKVEYPQIQDMGMLSYSSCFFLNWKIFQTIWLHYQSRNKYWRCSNNSKSNWLQWNWTWTSKHSWWKSCRRPSSRWKCLQRYS